MDTEFLGHLSLLLASPNQRNSTGTELARISTGHSVQPFEESHHLATETGIFLVGQVKKSPDRAADPINSSSSCEQLTTEGIDLNAAPADAADVSLVRLT
jgi:hypothetical protein